MEQEKYLKTVVLNKKMINIGFNKNEQTYFIEYLDDNGNLITKNCYPYLDYNIFLEENFCGCKNCEKMLKKMRGDKFIGMVCKETYEDIKEFYLVPPCKLKKESCNG